ncbi:MAG: Phosphatidylethanolamine-binding protein [Gammaproteobacteria bacterium]|jgi:Raf kinase inhibitor-like YbhB/YbcL family protein|nr:Phosphatidylethanolamine-binding protein [Gammaproteobacteria bacterium]
MFKKYRKMILLGLFLATGYSNIFALSLQTDLINSNGQINVQYSCKGGDQIPSVQWQDVPANSQSLALVLEDPDAPSGLWIHWLVWNIPATVTQLTSDVGVVGKNSWGNLRYQGPCPPTGQHRYYLHLYALDNHLTLAPSSTDAQLQEAIRDHVLAEAKTMGVMESQ